MIDGLLRWSDAHPVQLVDKGLECETKFFVTEVFLNFGGCVRECVGHCSERLTEFVFCRGPPLDVALALVHPNSLGAGTLSWASVREDAPRTAT